MRIVKGIFTGLTLAWVGATVSLAQTTETTQDFSPIQVSPLSLTPSDLTTFPSLTDTQAAALISALAATPTIPTAAQPPYGTFWSLANPDSAPLPVNVNGFPVWLMDAGNSYLLDDLDSDFAAHATLQKRRPMMSDSETPGFDDLDTNGTGTNTYFYSSYAAVDYGTNLWIAQVQITNSLLAGIGTNTEAGILYEIQSRTNLWQSDWQSEGFISGSGLTNWTPMSVAQNGRTDLFIRLRSWADNGSGLPLWWQLQNFGTTGVDPYGDPAGDGYSNLYKFQHGLNPFVSYAPPAPTFNVTPTTGDNGVIISWNPAQGAVQNYTIYRNGSAIATVSASTFSYADATALNLDDPDDANYPVYTVQANYSGAAYASPQQPPFNPRLSISPALIRGGEGRYILLVPNLPSGATTIRFYPQPSGADYPDDFFNAQTYAQPGSYFMPGATTNIIDVPASSFTNGEYVIPASLLPFFGTYGSFINCRAIGVDGSVGAASLLYLMNNYILAESEIQALVPFLDGTEQLKENLAFQLEAADELGSFAFYVDGANDTVAFPQNYAYAGFYFLLDFGDPQYKNAFLHPFKPFEDNYFYRNFVYAFTNLNDDGSLASGAFYDGVVGVPFPTLFSFDEYGYVSTGNTYLLAPQLSATNAQWLYSPYTPGTPDDGNIGITESGTNLFLNGGPANVFGLAYQSAIQTYNDGVDLHTNRLNSGGSIPDVPFTQYFYGQVTPPQLETIGYYFAVPNQDYLPGHAGFDPDHYTNAMLITAVGQVSLVAAWAKEQLVNGTPGKYGFLEQYFDQAYRADGGGNLDTNQPTGILSEYGEFLATEPGTTYLTTKRDGGNQGQFPIRVIALTADANHDGTIDPGLGSPDFASSAHPFRFWVNDNRDVGDDGGNFGIPGQGAEADGVLQVQIPVAEPYYLYPPYGWTVHGRRDLVDFFPVNLNIFSLFQSNAISAGISVTDPNYQFVLSQADGALRFAYTDLTPSNYLNFLRDTNESGLLAYAPLTTIPATGVALANAFLSGIATSNQSIILVEAWTNTTQPLVLTVFHGTNLIAQASLPLSITGVEQMFRHKNLLLNPSLAVTPSRLTDADVPNEPDTIDKNFVFLHGYNVLPNEARGVQADMFKRMYWAGSHAKFWGVTWEGADSKGSPPFYYALTPNYHTNVVNAFATAPLLANFIAGLTNSGPVVVAAHSLGNIVTLSAISDWNAPISQYFMLDAAVPVEAIDPGATTNGMIYSTGLNNWSPYTNRLYASYWYQLFPANDSRSTLSWNHRLGNLGNVDVYNFYSSGEEVLRTQLSDPPSSVLNKVLTQATDFWPFGIPFGSYTWYWQEKGKGTCSQDWFLGSSHGGWQMNYYAPYLYYSNGLPAFTSPAQAATIPNSQLMTNAFFRVNSSNWGDADLALFSSSGSTYAAANRNRILADAIPAMSLVAGANPVTILNQPGQPHNFDMMTLESGWSQGRTGGEVGKWHHSDFVQMAYTFTYPLFNKFATTGNLK
jgi:hypothetical protein